MSNFFTWQHGLSYEILSGLQVKTDAQTENQQQDVKMEEGNNQQDSSEEGTVKT